MSSNTAGAHYRVGRKIGEGTFGAVFEGLLSSPVSPTLPCPFLQLELVPASGTDLLDSKTVAIKFVSPHPPRGSLLLPFIVLTHLPHRKPERLKPPSW